MRLRENWRADAIVEGTVLRAGHRVRITAQLIDPVKESTCGPKATNGICDALASQSDLAQAIAREIAGVETQLRRSGHISRKRTLQAETYEA